MELHRSLNYVKGVVTCKNLLHIILEEIKFELAEQGIINVTLIMGIEKVPTALLVITFITPTVLQHIFAGYQWLIVRTYVPNS